MSKMIFFAHPQVATSSESAELQLPGLSTAPLPEAPHDQFVTQGILLGTPPTFKKKYDRLVQTDILEVNA